MAGAVAIVEHRMAAVFTSMPGPPVTRSKPKVRTIEIKAATDEQQSFLFCGVISNSSHSSFPRRGLVRSLFPFFFSIHYNISLYIYIL